MLSGNAHLITPYNITVDKVTERFLGKRKIGTTGRGIGPTYADKINRVGIRVQDLYDESILIQKVEAALEVKNQLLTKLYNRRAIEAGQVVEELLGYADQIKGYVADTTLILNKALDDDKVVLFEGGQGTLLDIDHGTYPFVTSSNPTAGGACTGAGVGPTKISRVIGILKAYTTRVGAGPFPTELFDEDGEALRRIGGERGVTTGRDRRCGWFDAVIARYATRVNGLTDFFLTKLDVLTGWEQIPVCVAYEIDGEARRGCRTRSPTSTTRSRSTRCCRAGPRTSPRPRPSRTSPRTPRRTSRRWRRCPAPRSPRSASAPAATRRSRSTRSCRRTVVHRYCARLLRKRQAGTGQHRYAVLHEGDGMLLRFRTANVRSLREEQELSFAVPEEEESAAARPLRLSDGKQLTVYPVLGIFGANASGKSNVITALKKMREAVLSSYAAWTSYEGIPREEFALDPKAAAETTSTRWISSWRTVSAGRTASSWASAGWSRSGSSPIPRDGGRSGSTGMLLARRIRLPRRSAAGPRPAGAHDPPQRPAADPSGQRRASAADPLYDWFKHNLWDVTPETERRQREAYTTQRLLENEESRRRVEELLRVADLGISGAEVERDSGGRPRVRLIHSGSGEETVLDWEAESFGTRSWFALIGPLLLALDTGAVLLVDELDASLHSRFAAEVVRLFQAPWVNPRARN